MAVKLVYHQNAIGHEINESLENNYPISDREIFCKRLHKITEPNAEDCDACPYFAGWMMGHGIECKWEDTIDINLDEKFIPHEKVREEMIRVSKLIDEGIIEKN